MLSSDLSATSAAGKCPIAADHQTKRRTQAGPYAELFNCTFILFALISAEDSKWMMHHDSRLSR
jgi:hypothetical protein